MYGCTLIRTFVIRLLLATHIQSCAGSGALVRGGGRGGAGAGAAARGAGRGGVVGPAGVVRGGTIPTVSNIPWSG